MIIRWIWVVDIFDKCNIRFCWFGMVQSRSDNSLILTKILFCNVGCHNHNSTRLKVMESGPKC